MIPSGNVFEAIALSPDMKIILILLVLVVLVAACVAVQLRGAKKR
jgi:hypothetical protein